MPHCVLTLRLIGLTFDYYDGKKKPDQLSEQQKKMALVECPSLLEMCGHVYFPGAFLVGPQFSMKRYLDFTRGIFDKVNYSFTFLFCAFNPLFFNFIYLFLHCKGKWRHFSVHRSRITSRSVGFLLSFAVPSGEQFIYIGKCHNQ